MSTITHCDTRRELRREATMLALRIVHARHIPERSSSASDYDNSDEAMRRFWLTRVANDASLYAEVMMLEATLLHFGEIAVRLAAY